MYILLAEEDHFYASMIIAFLKKEGFCDIKHIDNGVDCLLQVYEEIMPDLVIMDAHLNRVNGVEVLHKLITHKPGLNVIRLESPANGKKHVQPVQEVFLGSIIKDDQIFEHLMPYIHKINADVAHWKKRRPVTNLLVNFKRFIFAP